MVLSHKKLKRKRDEEAAAAALANPDAAGFAKEAKLKKAQGGAQKKKGKRTKQEKPVDPVTPVAQLVGGLDAGDGAPEIERPVADFVGVLDEGDGGVEIEKPIGGENAAKNRKKKEKKKRRKGGVDVATEGDEDRLSSGKMNGAVDHSEAEAEPTSVTVERGANCENGSAELQGQEAENGGHKGMTVRERKGKKKKDRWGGAVEEEEEKQEMPAVPRGNDEEEYKSQTSGRETDELSAGEEYDTKKVYVGGMPYYVSEDDIVEYFAECGKIKELDCVLFPDTGKFRGLAFITFETEESARKCLEWDGADMGGRFLKITKAKASKVNKSAELGEVKKHEGCLSVYIGNLAWDITEDVIKNFLKKHFKPSRIEAIRLAFDKETGEFKGFGHIDFGDDDSLEAAVRLNQSPLLGRPVKIAYSMPKRNPPSKNFNIGGDPHAKSRTGCHNCGEEGHKAFLCPLKAGRGGGRGGGRR
ncbi:hypothetical protein Mapa_009663 [Marchantia paleacea]|nr:hypothetical protein Mapa_009663 [Marchantia paleacea]